MSSEVYFLDLDFISFSPLYKYYRKFIQSSGLIDRLSNGDIVAIKLHMGEYGNTRYVRPQYIRVLVDMLLEHGCRPFLTDTTTLYRGSRYDALSYLETAYFNGFVYSVVNAPIIIADGLKGKDEIIVNIDGEELREIPVAKLFKEIDFLVVVSHFKGHEMSGFGGAIKNLGMGCTSKRGKLIQHAISKPYVDQNRCIACWTCMNVCQYNAIIREEKARIDKNKCVGCGTCYIHCPAGAIEIEWYTGERFLKRIVEAAFAVTKVVPREKMFFINFLTEITSVCDCMANPGIPKTRDIGILASNDPVAIDKASYDMVLKKGIRLNADGRVDALLQIRYAERMGLGTSQYKIIRVE